VPVRLCARSLLPTRRVVGPLGEPLRVNVLSPVVCPPALSLYVLAFFPDFAAFGRPHGRSLWFGIEGGVVFVSFGLPFLFLFQERPPSMGTFRPGMFRL
jgi:hypothetical protein